MKKVITRFNFHALRNETHVEFNEDFSAAVNKHGAGSIGIKTLFDAYTPLLAGEVALLDMIRKSELTARIEEQDRVRDDIYRGIVAAVASSLHHFTPAKRDAAGRLQVVIDNYGDISRKTYDDESAAINDILREFSTADHAPLVTLLALGEWTTQLAAANARFIELIRERYGELSQRPTARMKSARAAVDELLHAMIDRLEAVVLLNGIDFSDELSPFIHEYNTLATRYKNILASERGRRAAESSELPAME
jgi:hypothetical protein